jgi:uncharacterized protein YbbC (DUF1343 family)
MYPIRLCILLMLFCGGSLRAQVRTGAERAEAYLHLLKGRRVGLLVNHSAQVGGTHLLDTLLSQGINVVRVFAPEHGFRGMAEAGKKLDNETDPRTGIPIISLYGKKLKPAEADLADLDIVVFDIQDVGARFYTYISSLFYMEEACARNGKAFLVLDRPNPNGHYVDGPVLEPDKTSFVGIAPLPVVHGCTVGELANMFVGEGWIRPGPGFSLHVARCERYTHQTYYELPIKPSPNLPNMRSVLLYPALCLFEGTVVSVGRGTDQPFQCIGHPTYKRGSHQFVPAPNSGAQQPMYRGLVCRGYDYSHWSEAHLFKQKKLDLKPLLQFYRHFPDKQHFFLTNGFFDLLAGNEALRRQIQQGLSEADIRASWQPSLNRYKHMRSRYLLYPE